MRRLLVLLFLVGCTDVVAPAPPVGLVETDKESVMFFSGGQSNAAGERGLLVYRDHRALLGTRSAWPTFALRYHYVRGDVKVGTSNYAVGGSAQITGGSPRGSWGAGGMLLDEAFQSWDEAWAAFGGRLGGILWAQGERDARRIGNGSATQAEYRAELLGMIARVRERYGDVPFVIVRTGRDAREDGIGWRQVRAAQEQVARELTGVFVGSRRALSFPERGLMEDDVHWSVEGQEEIGRNAAARVLAFEALGEGAVP